MIADANIEKCTMKPQYYHLQQFVYIALAIFALLYLINYLDIKKSPHRNASGSNTSGDNIGISRYKAHFKDGSVPTPGTGNSPGDTDDTDSSIGQDHRPKYNIINRKVMLKLPGLDLYMFGAYLDDRFDKTMIRLFAMEKKQKEESSLKWLCKWTVSGNGAGAVGEVNVSPAKKYYVDKSWPEWSTYYARTFDCPFPKGSDIDNITLATDDGKFSFSLPVERTYTVLPARKEIAVCVKPITGGYSPSRLAEWFETWIAVGVEDFIMYDADLKGTGRYVLQLYEQYGYAKRVPFPYLWALLNKIDTGMNLNGQERYAAYQQTYLLAMHDCLYRFWGSYKYLVFIDLDEVILPTRNETLIDVLRRGEKLYDKIAGFLFNTAWHFEDHGALDAKQVPENLYMQKFVKATTPIDNQPKSVLVSDRVISMNFHTILDVPFSDFSLEHLPWEQYAYIHHYRGYCKDKFIKTMCQNMLKNVRVDPVISRYRERVKERVNKALDYLQLF